MKTMNATAVAALCMAAGAATIGFVAAAHANPPVGPCDGREITVAAGPKSAGLGHRALQLNFTLQSGASWCQLSGYPAVDADVDAEGASPVHAEQTPSGYLGGAVPGATVTLGPGHDAHAMVEWFAGGDPKCPTYGPTYTDVRLRVTPPGTSQTFTVPMSIGRNEGLCGLQVHPLTGDTTSETEAPDTGGTHSASSP